MKKWIVLLLVVGCGGPPTSKDPMNPLVEKISVEDLWAKDIDRLADKIRDTAEPGAYEHVDVLFQLAAKNPFEDIRREAGRALEVITGQAFGLDSPDARERARGLGRANSWWQKNRTGLMNSTLMDRLLPYLDLEDEDPLDVKRQERLLADLPHPRLQDAAYAISMLKDIEGTVRQRLQNLLKDPKASPRVRERVALSLEGRGDAVLLQELPGLVAGCEDPLRRSALLRIWGRQDPQSAAAAAWSFFESAADDDDRARNLAVVYGIDPERVARWCSVNIREGTDEEAAEGLDVASRFGMSEHLMPALERVLEQGDGALAGSLVLASSSLGRRRLARHLFSVVNSPDVRDRLQVLELMVALQDGVEEFEMIRLLKGDEDERRAAALMLRNHGSKSAVGQMIETLGRGGDTRDVLITLEVLTGHKFDVIDNRELVDFAKEESGSPDEIRARFIANRARLWWLDNRELQREDWLVAALNRAGFEVLREDFHPISSRERDLLRRLLKSDYPHKRQALATVLATGETSNVDFVLQVVRESQDGFWAPVLRPYVDKPQFERSAEFGRLFCTIAGPGYHRHFFALLRSEDKTVANDAARALEKWHGYSEIDNMISAIARGGDELPYYANDLLRVITGLDFGDITGITTPERKVVVDRWKSWWSRVHDDRFPGSWKVREISFLMGELESTRQSSQVSRRFRLLTHLDTRQHEMDWLRDWWARHESSWGPYGLDVADLTSGNAFRADRAAGKLLALGTPRDVVHMIQLLDPRRPREADRLLRVLRRLTGLDYGYRSDLDLEGRTSALGAWKEAMLQGNLPVQMNRTGS